ncbi:MAG: glycoside hydrolase family 3 protein [Candidatus Pacebacteria bacterium]|nr:glycoside hydrolase family 3 protein [Candidatus Paceibacterota bacterium]
MQLSRSPYFRTQVFIFLLALAAGILAYTTRFRTPTNQDVPELADPTEIVIPQAEIVTREYAQAQVAKNLYVPLVIEDPDLLAEQVAQLAAWRVGGIVVFGKQISLAEAKAVATELGKYPDWQPEVLVDHEGGTVQRYNGAGFTKLPSWQELCALPQTERRELLDTSLQELRDVGVTMVLAPMLDLGEKNSVLGTRLCSADPKVVVAAASDYILAARGVGIEPVLKHYPGIGGADLDTHKELPVIDPSLEEITVFSDVLDKFPDLAVMVGHVAIASRDPDTACSLSKKCIAAVTDSFPKVKIMSDALEMGGAKQDDTLSNTAKRALEAGNDYLLFGSPVTMDEIAVVLKDLTDTRLLQ